MKACRLVVIMIAALVVTAVATPTAEAQGGPWNYLSQYQFGLDYTNSYDGVSASYKTDRASAGAAASDECEEYKDDPESQRCSVTMRGGSSSGIGFFLQQAFRRQGQFYFNADVRMGARYLKGKMESLEAKKQKDAGLPLRSMEFALAAMVIKPYIQVGITPASKWPDIFLSLGPALQLAAGTVTVNGQKENVAIGTASGSGLGAVFNGFYELEVVFWRFGDGALSVFTSQDFTGGHDGTKFYPKEVDNMHDFKANFSRSVSGGVFGFGAKLLLNWP